MMLDANNMMMLDADIMMIHDADIMMTLGANDVSFFFSKAKEKSLYLALL